jgi:2-amino-4-hydroxy-6-hydroxymethyldihydropteridine diphosphokinase
LYGIDLPYQDFTIAYLGIGANLGDASQNIIEGLTYLESVEGVNVTQLSRLYRNSAVGGPENQPDYVNCVCSIATTLDPLSLLGACLRTEQHLGRIRSERWGPRTLDIDIILFGDNVIHEDGLTIPHPRLQERLFVLVPLSDIAPPDLKIPPDGRLLKNILAEQLTIYDQSLEHWVNNVL